jgi:hypothetical protein
MKMAAQAGRHVIVRGEESTWDEAKELAGGALLKPTWLPFGQTEPRVIRTAVGPEGKSIVTEAEYQDVEQWFVILQYHQEIGGQITFPNATGEVMINGLKAVYTEHEVRYTTGSHMVQGLGWKRPDGRNVVIRARGIGRDALVRIAESLEAS